ncbi:hypothetical protein HKX48_002126 [Thoreauomyces humboldtii]|nr:hypothetical protein HKX48_002126 [Thoreauomyces humboldtii]
MASPTTTHHDLPQDQGQEDHQQLQMLEEQGQQQHQEHEQHHLHQEDHPATLLVQHHHELQHDQDHEHHAAMQQQQHDMDQEQLLIHHHHHQHHQEQQQEQELHSHHPHAMHHQGDMEQGPQHPPQALPPPPAPQATPAPAPKKRKRAAQSRTPLVPSASPSIQTPGPGTPTTPMSAVGSSTPGGAVGDVLDPSASSIVPPDAMASFVQSSVNSTWVYNISTPETFDQNGVPRDRRKRRRTTEEEQGKLEDAYRKDPQMAPADREKLAKMLNMPPKSVQIWFQNRRQTAKKTQDGTWDGVGKWQRTPYKVVGDYKVVGPEHIAPMVSAGTSASPNLAITHGQHPPASSGSPSIAAGSAFQVPAIGAAIQQLAEDAVKHDLALAQPKGEIQPHEHSQDQVDDHHDPQQAQAPDQQHHPQMTQQPQIKQQQQQRQPRVGDPIDHAGVVDAVHALIGLSQGNNQEEQGEGGAEGASADSAATAPSATMAAKLETLLGATPSAPSGTAGSTSSASPPPLSVPNLQDARIPIELVTILAAAQNAHHAASMDKTNAVVSPSALPASLSVGGAARHQPNLATHHHSHQVASEFFNFSGYEGDEDAAASSSSTAAAAAAAAVAAAAAAHHASSSSQHASTTQEQHPHDGISAAVAAAAAASAAAALAATEAVNVAAAEALPPSPYAGTDEMDVEDVKVLDEPIG